MYRPSSTYREPEHQRVPAFFSRRTLAKLAAGALGMSAPGSSGRALATSQASATPGAASSGNDLAIKGMTYDTGTDYTPQWGVLSRQAWDLARVQRELAVIHDDLHCTAVTLFGTEISRLIEGADLALEQGLDVWIQPRLIDAGPDALLAHITETAREAERLRQGDRPMTLNLGVELSLFAAGIIEGATFEERIPILLATLDQLPVYNERLNALLARANTAAREVFHGPVTYGAGPWEGVDWTDFDSVGMDLYRDAFNRDTYVEQVRALHRWDKPVVITEFGCCTYEGAQDAGASGYDIIDWETTPPELNGDYVRSEAVQAQTIAALLDIYRTEGVQGAFVFTFVEPLPYSPDPRYDLDMASFGIVKVFPEESGQGYEATGHWEPKQAFHEIARQYGPA